MRDATAYVSREIFRLPADMNIGSFKAAWEAIFDITPILRTRILLSDTLGSFQVVLKEKMKWASAGSLTAYIEEDKELNFRYGSPMTRFGIAGEENKELYFIWTAHHSIYDGWSRSTILREVKRAFQNCETRPTPPFNRFIKYLQDIDSGASDKFWRNRFVDTAMTKYPQLPYPDYRPQVNNSLDYIVTISQNKYPNMTMATLIRAAWGLVMSQYSNSDHVVFGVIQAGRNAPVVGILDMAGPTITTVPVDVRVDKTKLVNEFLSDIQTDAANMMPFEHAGLQHIRRLGVDCQDACNFHNLLVIQPADDTEESGFLGLQKVDVAARGFLTYPLAMECTLGNGKISLTAGYDSDVISKEQTWRIIYQFEHMLQQLTGHATGLTVGDVCLISSNDKQDILGWNSDYPDKLKDCVHHMISRRTQAQPHSIAIDSWDATLTYMELERLSDRLSKHLISLGIGPEKIVPLCFEKSAWAIVSMLAVIKAGGAFVFLDASHPISRLEEISGQVGATLVLTSSKNCHIWESRIFTFIVSLDSIETLPENSQLTCANITPQNILYIIFTSGSTGKPKGCMVEHASMLSGSVHQARESRVGPESRVLQFASYTFDVSILEMITALLHGACICIPSSEALEKGIASVINEMKISWVFLTPSVVKIIGPKDVPTLKTLVLGGEALSRMDVELWADHLQLVNGYGPSETSVAATCNAAVSRTTDPANIGRAIGGVCWIVNANDHDQLVPVGVTGELLIEGPIVARGYLNEPVKTKAVFIESPKWLHSFTGRSGRLYKTGDLVRYNLDGTINFVGRKDTQVKVRGQRVELGEIEHHLAMNTYVRHCAVLLPSSGRCQQRLAAIMSLRGIGPASSDSELNLISEAHMDAVNMRIAEITDHLSQHVPTYMLPAVWIVVDDIPLLSSGKMNRKKLSTWLENIDEEAFDKICKLAKITTVETPSTEMERQIQEVWSTVLHLPLSQVGLRRTFLSLGGDSISAMQVATRCRNNHIEVSTRDVLRCKTISDLALCAKPASDLLELPDEEIDTPFNLSPIQQLYASHALGPDNLSRSTNKNYNFSFCLRLKKQTPAADLARAFEAVINHHSMLRARFKKDTTGKWTQYITRDIPGSYSYRVHEKTTLESIKPSLEDSRTCLDIENGPILAADLVDVSDSCQYLFLVAHHLVIDIVSWSVVLQDLQEFLDSSIISSPKPLSFQTWCHLEAEHNRHSNPSAVLPVEIAPSNFGYWGMKDCENTLRHTVEQKVIVNSSMTSLLLGSLNTVLQTDPIDLFISALLQSFSDIFRDRKPPTIFNYGHGRFSWDSAIDVSRTVGWFTTMAPISVPVETGENITHAIQRTKEARTRLPENGASYFASRYLSPACSETFKDHLDMEVIVNYLGFYQQITRSDARLELHNGFEGGFGAKGHDVKRFSLFNVTVTVEEGCLCFCFAYNTRMLYQDKISNWIKRFEETIASSSEELMRLNRKKSLAEESVSGGISDTKMTLTVSA